MAFEKSLYEFDAGYFEYIPGLWLPGKTIPGSKFGCMSKKAVDAAINVELDDSDVLLGTYPKTGKWTVHPAWIKIQGKRQKFQISQSMSLTITFQGKT